MRQPGLDLFGALLSKSVDTEVVSFAAVMSVRDDTKRLRGRLTLKRTGQSVYSIYIVIIFVMP